MPVLSFVTVVETHFWAEKDWGPNKMRNLEEAIRPYVVAPYDEQMAPLWGRLKAQALRAGHALGAAEQTNDLWLCTIAIFHQALQGLPGSEPDHDLTYLPELEEDIRDPLFPGLSETGPTGRFRMAPWSP